MSPLPEPPVAVLAVLAELEVPGCRCVSVCADGSAVFIVADGRAEVREHTDSLVWSSPVDAPGELPVEAVWTPDSEWIFVVGGARLQAFAADTGAPIPLPEELAARRDVTAIALTRDGTTLAVGTREGAILLLDRSDAAVVRWTGRADPVRALAFHPSGAELCVARPRAIQFRSLADRTMIASVHAGDSFPSRLAWSQDGTLIAVAGLHDVRTVDVRTRGELTQPLAVTSQPVALGFSRDGTHILVGTRRGPVHLLDRQLVADDVAAATIPAELSEPGMMHIGACGLLAVRSGPRAVTLWRLPDTRLPTADQRMSASLARWSAKTVRTIGWAARSAARSAARPTEIVPPGTARWGPGFCWAPDGRSWYVESPDGTLVREAAVRTPLWQSPLALAEGGVHDIESSGPLVAVAGRNPYNVVRVLDTVGGELLAELPGGQGPAWSPGNPRMLAVPGPRPGAEEVPTELLVYRDIDRSVAGAPQVILVRAGTGRPAWSPDGRLLAAPAGDEVGVWRTDGPGHPVSVVRLGDPAHRGLRVGPVAWSPDGRFLAAVPVMGGAPVIVWDTQDWQRKWALGRPENITAGPGLAWSPDSRLLAFPSAGPAGAVELWRPGVGPAHTIPSPDGTIRYVWAIRWSPDGCRLAVTYDGGHVIRWELPDDVLPHGGRTRLPYDAEVLGRMGASAAVAGAFVPMSLLADLLTLLLSRAPDSLGELEGHRAVVALRSLRWPMPAALGLAVLIAADLPPDPEYGPPPEATTEQLQRALLHTLNGVPVPPSDNPPPMTALVEALGRIDDSVLTLVALLGPEAVAAEPELPARLRGLGTGLWPLPERQRKLLGVRATVWHEGTVQGRGLGDTRAGVSRQGELSALLPSQLALPPRMLAARHVRDELLFRTRQGTLPAATESMIVVLDDTPPAHGAVGATLRIVAHLLCAHLIARHRRCALILLGGPASMRILSTTTDLVRIWGDAAFTPPATDEAFRLVTVAAAQLGDAVTGTPRTVVLTHPHLVCGRDVDVVRVHYPGHPITYRSPRTFSLPPGAGPEEVFDVIGGILGGQPQSI